MSSLRLFISTSYDPWFNLAVEETIFKHMSSKQRVLFLWRNDNTVVIGRAQNPWKECNTLKMEQDKIKLARRSSGGGAVFHDLGNTCFTFMAAKPEYNKQISTQIVLNALSVFGLQVLTSGRNDIVIQTTDGEKKISGSAYKETIDRGFHHGSLLLNADLTKLSNYLNPDPKKLQAKGISSVRSRVTNLSQYIVDINHDKICQAITHSFCDHYGESVNAEYISPQSPPNVDEFNALFAKQSSWQWNFGNTPEFNHLLEQRFTWGGVEIHFNIEKGLISNCQIFTDSLYVEPFELLAKKITNTAYQVDNVLEIMNELIQLYSNFEVELNQLSTWLIDKIV